MRDLIRRHRWAVGLGTTLVLIVALVAAVGIHDVSSNQPPVTPAGWTGLEGRIYAAWSVGPIPQIAIVAEDGDVTNANADANGWFKIPLRPGYYNITWMTGGGPFIDTCHEFDQQDAIHVTQGRATKFSQTHTNCVQGD